MNVGYVATLRYSFIIIEDRSVIMWGFSRGFMYEGYKSVHLDGNVAC